jgi:phospholipid transport system substrate-binding protein
LLCSQSKDWRIRRHWIATRFTALPICSVASLWFATEKRRKNKQTRLQTRISFQKVNAVNMFSIRSWWSQLAAAVVASAALAVFAQVAPDAQVKAVATEVTGILKSDPAILNNQTKLRDLIETKLVPNFNFMRMTQLAMGRNWSKASPEQQATLTKEFRTLLVRTYSSSLANFKNNTIDYRPLRMQSTETDVTIKTVVQQANGQGIPIDYSMEKGSDGSWKAYDVAVAGVSLVTNYREEFNSVISGQGVDALIKQLQSKNK